MCYLPAGHMAGPLAEDWAEAVVADRERRQWAVAREAAEHFRLAENGLGAEGAAPEGGNAAAASAEFGTAARGGKQGLLLLQPGDFIEAQLTGLGEASNVAETTAKKGAEWVTLLKMVQQERFTSCREISEAMLSRYELSAQGQVQRAGGASDAV